MAVPLEISWKTHALSDKLFHDFWRSWVSKKVGSTWTRMLDLGGGTGASTVGFARKNHTIVCLDISRDALLSGKKTYSKVQRMHYVLGDATVLPFQDEVFDIVHCEAALHHFPDRNRALEEVKRILKPGGKFLAWEPGLTNPFAMPARKFFRTTVHDESEKPFVPSSLVNLISKHFVNVDVRYFGLLTYVLPFVFARFEKIGDFTSRVFPYLIRLDKDLSRLLPDFAGVVALYAEKRIN